MIESILKYLEDNKIGEGAKDLFIGEIPVKTNNAIALIYSLSPYPNKAIDLFTQDIDFRGRFSRSDLGYGKMEEIFKLLHRAENYDVEGYHVYFSHALGTIEDNDRDAERRKLYKLTVRFIFRLATS